MVPKKRKPENRKLPARWVKKHGAYYFIVPDNLRNQWEGKRWYRLGKTEAEAYRLWSERMNFDPAAVHSMAELFDRYALEVLPEKTWKSRESNRISIQRLRPVFGHMRPDNVKPKHAYAFMDRVAKKHGTTSANRDLEVLRHCLSKAVEWGVLDQNQIKGQVRRLETKPRDRLVEDWEIAEARSVASPTVSAYIRFKLMTGLRRGDILRLQLSNLRNDGIHIQTSKTGKRLIIEWDEDGELRSLVDEILRLPPRRIGDAPLFTTRQGKPYIDNEGRANGFDSLWQRFMAKVMKTTKVRERFQERDLRAKVASDSGTLQEASERLGHAGTEITKRVYRRKPVRVQPLVKPKSE